MGGSYLLSIHTPRSSCERTLGFTQGSKRRLSSSSKNPKPNPIVNLFDRQKSRPALCVATGRLFVRVERETFALEVEVLRHNDMIDYVDHAVGCFHIGVNRHIGAFY